MFFSVIVPVYKVEEYLGLCIESVLNQTFSDFELILVDDGSPDACPAICEDYAQKDPRIKVLHKQNGGLASARRAGIKVAEGAYVFNLDSDDQIELDTLETAHRIIEETGCQMVSFSYRWVKNGETVSVTTDGLPEGLYSGEALKEAIYPRILMDRDMNHISYYLAGKAIRRDFLTPIQLAVSEKISLGEDLCCVVPCYLNLESVYISPKTAYLYNVRENSISKEFNVGQIDRIRDVIEELSKNDTSSVADFEAQLCRYSCFMCFAILASAAEGGYFKSIQGLKEAILRSDHRERIQRASFDHITLKSKISVFLMKRNCYRAAFYFLNFCKIIKGVLS